MKWVWVCIVKSFVKRKSSKSTQTFTRVKYIVDILQELLLHNLSVGEQKHRIHVSHSGVRVHFTQILEEGGVVIVANQLDLEAPETSRWFYHVFVCGRCQRTCSHSRGRPAWSSSASPCLPHLPRGRYPVLSAKCAQFSRNVLQPS